MARLIHGAAMSPAPRRSDPLTDLSLLLSRLQRTILHADAEREARLRESEFEREKAHANISYARSLLTKLEQDALALKIHARRHDIQADLLRKRDLLDQLTERLNDLAEFAAAAAASADAGDGEEDTSDSEDILAQIIATPSESLDSSARSPDMPPQEPQQSQEARDSSSENGTNSLEPPSQSRGEQQQQQQPSAPPPSPPQPEQTSTPSATSQPPTTTSQNLRSRKPHQSSITTAPTTNTTSPPAATPTPAPQATTTANALFSDRASKPTHPLSSSSSSRAAAAVSTTEAILDHQRAEQDALSESILKLAAELKASSHAFSASLDEDRALVERAGRGMERTGEQMATVSRRVGALQRMAEEEGWLGRMKLYAMVYGLMVLLVVVVFVLPKLRF